MVSKPLRRPATYADLKQVPDAYVAEIVGGTLYASPRPVLRHAVVTSTLGVLLGGPFHHGLAGGPGGWWILDEPEIHLFGGREIVVPDLAGWRREEVPEIPDRAYAEVPPGWVCEVLSPATAALDRSQKLPLYARAGVAYAWLIDPVLRTLEVLQREADTWPIVATHVGDAAVRVEPFAAVDLELRRLWDVGAPTAR